MFKEGIVRSILFAAILAFISASAFSASLPGAVNKNACGNMANTTLPFVLVLDRGDDLHKSIAQCAKDAKLIGASVSGIGGVHNPTLAYFDSNAATKPTLVALDGSYELGSLTGNISNNAGKYYAHLHAVLAHGVAGGIAGHLEDAKVVTTLEVTITPLAGALQRSDDEKLGFGLIMH